MVAAKETSDRCFTPEEYCAWEEQQLEKHEWIDGRVYAMAGGSKNHSIIKLNFGNLIKPHLQGPRCQVFNSDLRVNILHTTNFTYADLSVTCDDRDRQGSFLITYPCLIAGDRVELRSIDLRVPIEQFYEDVDLSPPAVETTAQ